MTATDVSAGAEDGCADAAVIQVVAAIIVHPDGRILMAQRPAGKVYAGYWEFPGGKIEPGESEQAALARELHEELGIEVTCAYRWITRRYAYAHATVDLHFYRVVGFNGTLHAREAQAFRWQRLHAIDVDPILPANGPIIAALRLPPVYAITNAAELGPAVALSALTRALEAGTRLIQVREPQMSPDAFEKFARQVIAHAQGSGARVLVNADVTTAQRVGADGVHLKAAQLRSFSTRPALALVAASCHDAAELELARALDVDFVVLGPVAPTLSHPDAAGIGWQAFERLIRGFPAPVYALGGMRMQDLERAWLCGAHGISMQRAAWEVSAQGSALS
jgi:8-oxo-dGTP diphosphatase